jgi:hypothetical protein
MQVRRSMSLSIRSMLRELTGSLRPAHPLTQNRELDALVQVSSYESADDSLLMLTAQEFMAAGRVRGVLALCKLARAQPERMALASLEGMLQARVAHRVPLLGRIAWVKRAIARLNAGAANDSLSRRDEAPALPRTVSRRERSWSAFPPSRIDLRES